jgi:hypothetical protein
LHHGNRIKKKTTENPRKPAIIISRYKSDVKILPFFELPKYFSRKNEDNSALGLQNFVYLQGAGLTKKGIFAVE